MAKVKATGKKTSKKVAKKPAAKPVKKAPVKTAAKPAKKAAAKPAKKAAAKPAKKAAAKPAKKTPVKAAAKPAKKAPVKAAAKPATKAPSKPATKKKATKASKKVRPPRPAAHIPDLADFSIDSKVSQERNVASTIMDGKAVIITPADSTTHSLNDVGTRIWEMLTGKRTLKEVAAVLTNEFEVDQERAELDTLWFVECLAKKGLVELA